MKATTRNEEMIAMRRRGASFEEIGERFGVTRQRANQLAAHVITDAEVASVLPLEIEITFPRHGLRVKDFPCEREGCLRPASQEVGGKLVCNAHQSNERYRTDPDYRQSASRSQRKWHQGYCAHCQREYANLWLHQRHHCPGGPRLPRGGSR